MDEKKSRAADHAKSITWHREKNCFINHVNPIQPDYGDTVLQWRLSANKISIFEKTELPRVDQSDSIKLHQDVHEELNNFERQPSFNGREVIDKK